MEASIITIGDELLIGQVLDTNSQYLSQQLQDKGIKVRTMLSCGDSYKSIWKSIDSVFAFSDIIFVTGGLGPTKDDITKKILCDYFNDSLYFNEDLYKEISERYEKKGVKMTEGNKSQAMLPVKAKIFRNELGSAQGMLFEKDGKYLISLPGVPAEMIYIFENEISNYLDKNFSSSDIYHKTFILSDISESMLAEIIEDWENSLPEFLKIAYLPSYHYLRIRISCYSYKGKESLTEKKISELIPLISKYIISDRDESIEELLGRLLREKNASLSTAESCSGGKIATMITRISGASDYFKGSVVAYSNEVKENVLKVNKATLLEYGAVSEEVVCEMAVNVRRLLNSDFSIATSGIAGPSGGSKEKPVGTICIAIADKENVYSCKKLFGNIRELNILRSTNLAMIMLIKKLREI